MNTNSLPQSNPERDGAAPTGVVQRKPALAIDYALAWRLTAKGERILKGQEKANG